MKKVFLVDDEIVIRENMRTCIDWEEEGFEYCGDAPDGEVALPLIEELKPDILITDIKMPFMNGLELSAVVRRIMPRTKIVIISGHDDFEYTRQAIRLGVEDYCLKPFGSADIIRLIRLIRAKLDKEQALSNNAGVDNDQILQRLQSTNKQTLLEMFGETTNETAFLDRRPFIEYLKVGHVAQCDEFVLQFANELRSIDWQASLYGYYALKDLTIEVFREAQSLFRNVDVEAATSSFLALIVGISSLEEARQYLRTVAEQFWSWRSQASSKYGDMIAQIKAFVHANYANDRLSLQDAAEHVCVSPSHMSKIFSQETGQTFIEYLMHTRIEQAKLLLQSTNAKSYEIAYQVGYQDPHYFSSLFKRVTGMRIRDFRKRNQMLPL